MNKLLAKQIIKLADTIAESKTLQKRAKKFDTYLKKWDIYRLTSSKRKEIYDLFKENNLEIIDPVTKQNINIEELDRDKKIIIRYNPKNSDKKINYEKFAENENLIFVKPASGSSPKKPYIFQAEAHKALSKFYSENNKKGLLILPTGAGKTFTAVSWLLRNVVDKNKKIIWIAHRHELLEQVKDEFKKLSFENYLPNRKDDKISIHLISGSHDKARKINKNDDILIASVQSLNRNIEYLTNNYLKKNDDIFFVIDEAHHATARTYRNLIDTITKHSKNYNILGLTATPYRTAEKEKSYLSKIFDKTPIYSKDLKDLIIDNTLSEPIFVPVKTNINFTKKDFSDKELNLLRNNFDLPEEIKKKIIEQKDRNRLIVNHYLKNKDKYKQTLIFALNQTHAIQLNELFKQNGIKTDYVISGTKSFIGVSVDKKNNQQAINDFRENKLEALVNVNILTEGTDLPNTQTVFLTRPTKSKTLMTQMVGRALRGPKAGGTDKAYIVSFIDNWSDLVAWQNPYELFVDENDILDKKASNNKYKVSFISIELINQFAKLADSTIDTDELESYSASMRIPLGWYSFELEKRISSDDIDYKSCKILVYEQHKQAYDDFANDIERLFNKYDYNKNGILDEFERQDLFEKVKETYFENLDFPEPKIQDNDILDLIEYYEIHRKMPVFFTFEEREKYDISRLVKHIIVAELNNNEEKDFIKKQWNGVNGKSIWKEFYNNNMKYFLNDIDLEKRKINYPEEFENPNLPTIEYAKEKLEDLELHKWPIEDYKMIREQVFEKWNKEHPDKKITKSDRWKYQIDHIIPFSKGGKTILSNLQPLTVAENIKKGDTIE